MFLNKNCMTLIFRIIFILLIFGTNLHSQSTLRGFVKDSLSNEALVGSYVILGNKVVDTDANGYFELNIIGNENLLIEVYQIGYKSIFKSLIELDMNKINIFKLAPNMLTEVVISSSKDKIPVNKLSTFKITSNEIKRLASLAGEPDLLQALHFKSGFQPISEGLSGVVARGGLPDQNLLLVNGVRVYNYAHVFGFLSFVNGEMIKDVAVYKSGFPGRYGGKASSIIDMTLFDGNSKKVELDATIGTLTSKFSLKAPIIKDKWGFTFGGRVANLGVINFFSGKNYDQNETGSKVNINIHDFTFNTKYLLSSTSNISCFIIKSTDEIETKDKRVAGDEDIRFSGWSNIVSGLKFHKILPNSLKLELGTGFLQYKNFFDETTIREREVTEENSLSSGLEEFSFYNTLTKYFNNNISSSVGISYFSTKFNSLEFSNLKDTVKSPEINQSNFNIFTSVNADFKKFRTEVSLRYDIFGKNLEKGVFQPRIRAVYQINEKATINSAYDVTAQNAFQVPAFNNEPPLDIWVPLNNAFELNKNKQFSLGGIFKIKNNLTLGIELFHKSQKNIIDNTVVYSGISEGATELNNTLSYDGKLDAYGTEVECNLSYKNISLESSYTYTSSKTSFQNIQGGDPFSTNFLRPHSYKMNMNIMASKAWNFSIKGIWMSGQPFTAPIGAFYDDSNGVNYIYGNRNNGRYPSYFRMDIGVNLLKGKKNTFSCHVYNITARRNPFFIYIKNIPFRREPNNSSSGYFDNVLFTILPSISYSRKFL